MLEQIEQLPKTSYWVVIGKDEYRLLLQPPADSQNGISDLLPDRFF